MQVCVNNKQAIINLLCVSILSQCANTSLFSCSFLEDVVEIETGDGDVLAVLKYIIASSISSRSHKSSPIWIFFAQFDCTHHPDKKTHRICLVCHGLGIDKSISVGKDYSNTPLVAHFQTKHKDKFTEYLSLKEAQSLQSHSHLKVKSDACFRVRQKLRISSNKSLLGELWQIICPSHYAILPASRT